MAHIMFAIIFIYINDLSSCLQTVPDFFADNYLLDMEALTNFELCDILK